MSTAYPERDWFCPDVVVEEYRRALSNGDDFPMLKALKIIRGTVVNLGIIAITLYALRLGGDPTYITVLSLLLLSAYNGIEWADYLALLQAYEEIQSADDGGE